MSVPGASQRAYAFNLRGTEITYSILTDPEPDLKTGTIAATSTDTVIARALVGYATEDDIAGSEGRYKQGDRVYRIRSTDITGLPDRGALITHQGRHYNVVGWRSDQNNSVYDLYCREP